MVLVVEWAAGSSWPARSNARKLRRLLEDVAPNQAKCALPI
jgi:hypothetical protein